MTWRTRRAAPMAVGTPHPWRTTGRPRWARPALWCSWRRPPFSTSGTWGVGLGQLVLLGGGAGRHEELEGLLLRLLRRLELHHRRQTAGLAVGHGYLRPDLRRQRLEDPRASGARRRGHGGAGLRDRAAVVHARGRPARGRSSLALTPVAVLMFRFNNPDALLRPPAHGRGLCDAPGRSRRADTLVARSPAAWSASGSSPRCSRPSWSSRPSASSTCSRRRPRSGGGCANCAARGCR